MARRTLAALLAFLLFSSVLTTGVWAQVSQPPKEATPPKEDVYELHKLLVDTLDQVQRNYVKEVSRRELIEAAIKGVLDHLDPYSSYIGPEEMGRFRASVEAEFGGIGIQITVEHGHLEVLSPLVGTPAYRAGITAGDRIIEIDGQSTAGINIDEAVRRLKGEAGTEVTLTVIHPGSPKKEKISVTREMIHINTVLGDRRKDDGTWDFVLDAQQRMGYIRITAFSRSTAGELRRALSELQKEGFRGLILDLRFNPGGLLSSAIEVSDLFISEGRIVSVKGKGPVGTRVAPVSQGSGDNAKGGQQADGSERVWDAHEEGTFTGFPMVVLVNRYSASASEIVSACLQDHKRAKVMGERTWGKGSVQNVIGLEIDPETEQPRSALKLTTASYCRPNGENIHRFPRATDDDQWGVKPDAGYELKLTDRQLRALFRYRRQRDVLRPKPQPEADTAESATQPEDDKSGDQPPQADGSAADQDEQSEAAAENEPATEPEEAGFVDLQLQKAVDYLASLPVALGGISGCDTPPAQGGMCGCHTPPPRAGHGDPPPGQPGPTEDPRPVGDTLRR